MRQAAFDIFTMVEMAFGTWLKGLISTVGSAVKKALPIAKKVVDTVAPMAQQVGRLIGGKIGSGIQKAAGFASGLVGSAAPAAIDTASGLMNRTLGSVGANGGGIRKLIPRLK